MRESPKREKVVPVSGVLATSPLSLKTAWTATLSLRSIPKLTEVPFAPRGNSRGSQSGSRRCEQSVVAKLRRKGALQQVGVALLDRQITMLEERCAQLRKKWLAHVP